MKYYCPFFLLFCLSACSAQHQQKKLASYRLIGGPCEICDWIEDYHGLDLKASDTLPDFASKPQPIKITGTIYESDGKTPSRNTILFIYHTDETGVYQWRNNDQSKRYVHHRGWIRTGADGQYTFYTFLPGAYPGGSEPQHIHPIIKESDGKAYYIDEFLFEGDPLLTEEERKNCENRGGSGIVTLVKADRLRVAQRDIVLGLNIPGYE